MATDVARTGSGKMTDGPAGDQSSADPAEMFRRLTAWVRTIYPTARNLRVLCDVPGEDGGETTTAKLPVPAAVAPADDMKTAILQVLGRLKPGEYLGGKAVAMMIDEDLDHKSGAFTRAVAALRDCDPPKIETHRTHGYRLALRD